MARPLRPKCRLDGIPEDSRAARGEETFNRSWLNEETVERLRALNEVASRRGQSLAQLALAWAGALDNLSLSGEELAEIDMHASADGQVDIWAKARVGEW